jgi:mannose-6-phosphate isomerase-like protein (cupin superfamily)
LVVQVVAVVRADNHYEGETDEDTACREWSSNYPPIGGFRFSIIQVPAGYDPKEHPESHPEPTPEQVAVLETEPGHDRSHMGAAGVHWTESVDCEVMLSGELILELDDGHETVVRAGDTIVQNGTRHRWRNVGDQTAVFVAFLVGADHKFAN